MYMNSRVFVSIAAALMLCGNAFAQRTETLLEKGWRFHLGEADASSSSPGFDDSSWEEVTVPHDWAIYGPFDVSNDLQTVAVTQNFENEASMKTGRTGGLPYVGIGFDGAMSEARVYVNGEQVCFWPYGYSSFWCDVTDVLTDGDNVLAVRLENLPQSSRWYPGAGLSPGYTSMRKTGHSLLCLRILLRLCSASGLWSS